MSGIRSEYFVRTAEARAVLSALEDQRSAALIGPEGSGRSTVLRAVSDALQDSGRSVLFLRGNAAAQGRPLAALNLEGSLTPREARSDAGIAMMVQEIADRLANRSSLVILIDDAGLVDPTTWTVLAAVHRRTGVPIVAAAARRTDDLGDPTGLDSAGIRHARIRLEPLRFDAVNDLLHGIFEANVDPSLVSKIYLDSGGNAGLAVALALSASSNGSLQMVAGSWEAAGELVSASLRARIDASLDALEPAEREAMEALALAGVVDAEAAYRLVDATMLESLEIRELVVTLVAAGRTMIAVNPPLLSDHFRARPASVRRARLLERVRRVSEDVEKERTANAKERAAVLEWPDIEASAPALARLIQEQQQTKAKELREIWRGAPSAATAVPLIRVLFALGAAAEEVIAEVFDRTPEDSEPGPAAIAFQQAHATWLAFQRHDLRQAGQVLQRAAELFPNAALSFECLDLQLGIRFKGIPSDIDDRFQRLLERGAGTLPEFALVRAYCALARGVFSDALSILDALPNHLEGELRIYAGMLRALALYEAGELDEALSRSIAATDDARAALDTAGIRLHSYVAILVLLQQGRLHEAERMIEDVFSLGPPGVTDTLQYLAALVLGAFVAARHGRIQAAESLTEQARRLHITVGPFPGMDRSWAVGHLLSATGQRQEAARVFRGSAAALRERGYGFAANFAVLSELELQPQLELAQATETTVLAQGGGVQLPLVNYHLASARADAVALEAAADAFLEAGQHALAAGALLRTAQVAREQGQPDRALELQGRARELVEQEGLSVLSTVSHVSADRDKLTDRELEVASLAAKGLSNQDIAEQVGVGVRTVESHLSRVFQKLGINRRSELTLFMSGSH